MAHVTAPALSISLSGRLGPLTYRRAGISKSQLSTAVGIPTGAATSRQILRRQAMLWANAWWLHFDSGLQGAWVQVGKVSRIPARQAWLASAMATMKSPPTLEGLIMVQPNPTFGRATAPIVTPGAGSVNVATPYQPLPPGWTDNNAIYFYFADTSINVLPPPTYGAVAAGPPSYSTTISGLATGQRYIINVFRLATPPGSGLHGTPTASTFATPL